MMLAKILMLLVLGLLINVTINKWRRQRSKKLPPGPPPLPIIGNLHQLSTLLHKSLYDLSLKHGPLLHLRLGRIPYVVVSSPEHAEQVMKIQDLAFCSRPQLYSVKAYSYNALDVASAPYGPHWRNLRKVYVNKLLGLKNLPFFGRLNQEEVARMMSFVEAAAGKGEVVDITEMMFQLTSRVVNMAAFGHREPEGNTYGDKSRFHGMLAEMSDLMGIFWVEDFFPGFGWFDILRGLRRRLKMSTKQLDDFYRQIIEQHLHNATQEEDIVDVLIRLWKGGQHDISIDHIKGALVDILSGGTHTSATTLIWSMTELIKKPSVMMKVQSEVRESIGSKGKVDESDIPKLTYLKAVLCETFRLHPPIPLLLPRETRQAAVIDGYGISAKTVVLVNVWAIGRDNKYWENALDFNPDRFLTSNVDYKGKNFEFLPFGAGRRMCPGMDFGISTIELALANLLYAFDWELPTGVREDDVDMEEVPGIGVNKKTTLYLVAKNWIPA